MNFIKKSYALQISSVVKVAQDNLYIFFLIVFIY